MKKVKYIVRQYFATRGGFKVHVVWANTPKGASMIVNRDHWDRFSYNVVYSADNVKVLFTSAMN